MTDELELLKRDWQKKEAELPKLSYEDIHKMIWKKSSSIVKWILIISILEFTIPQLLLFVPALEETMQIYENIGVSNYLFALSLIIYAVVLFFIFQFYRRYTEISVLDNSKNLMKKILRTRKTVKHYVLFSLSMILVTIIIMLVGVYLNEDITHIVPELGDKLEKVSPDKLRMTLMLTLGIFGLVFTVFMGGIYFLLYGLLLRKLNKNYAELKQLEI
jgi:MFS family permease